MLAAIQISHGDSTGIVLETAFVPVSQGGTHLSGFIMLYGALCLVSAGYSSNTAVTHMNTKKIRRMIVPGSTRVNYNYRTAHFPFVKVPRFVLYPQKYHGTS